MGAGRGSLKGPVTLKIRSAMLFKYAVFDTKPTIITNTLPYIRPITLEKNFVWGWKGQTQPCDVPPQPTDHCLESSLDVCEIKYVVGSSRRTW